MIFCRSVSFEYEILLRVKCTKFSWVAGEDRLTEIDENIQMELFPSHTVSWRSWLSGYLIFIG